MRFARPLIERRTWRRWAHLVVGGALLMPFWFFALSLTTLLPTDNVAVVLVLSLLVVPTAATFVTGLVPTVRLLEGSLARELLKGPAADLTPGSARSWESRVRAASWFTLHLSAGVVVSGLSLTVPPLAVVMILAPAVSWDTRFLASWGGSPPGRSGPCR